MIESIYTDDELCVGCNRCVRECPMEMANITFQDEAGNIKVKIDNSKCIACGRCVTACKHHARYYIDDTDRFFRDLSAGMPISLIAAPSIRTNVPEYKRLFTYLKNIGVQKIFDVSLGADICVWAHIRYFQQTGAAPIITQPCPAIVSYCKIYRHDLLQRLSPIHSPMASIAVYMRQYEGISDGIAALSPCIAKSDEFEDTGLTQYNVTFQKLREYLAKHEITLPEEETGFDHYNSSVGSLFPMPGGLKENIEFYLGKELHLSKAEGRNVYDKLNAYGTTEDDLLPLLFDVLNCDEGCNIGPGSMEDRNIFTIDRVMNESRAAAMKDRDKAYFDELFKGYDEQFALSHFIREYRGLDLSHPQITDKDIENAYILLGKDTQDKRNIDCGACGSETCYDMARKIALKVNIPINCIVNDMETARDKHAQAVISERANKAKSDFLSSMSHEMRTPMNAIIGMAQIAAKTNEVERLKYCLTNIENSSAHLLGLINDILDMSKIEAGKLELESTPLNIEKMLIRVCNLMIDRIEQKDIQFHISLGANMRMHYIGDELRLSQVVTNLLSNAVKFTPAGGRIELTAEETERGESHSVIQFAVKDTGIGIKEEQIGLLFSAFQQADSSTTRQFGGTGLGLAISRSIIEMMHGSIWVESTYQAGSTFTFNVKLERMAQQGGPVIFGNISPSDIRLLVVDPDKEERENIHAIVNSFGITDVDEAETVGRAVDLAVRAREGIQPYDAIFVDYTLATERNIEYIRNSSLDAGKENIVMMTTFINWNKIAEMLLSIGIKRFISKPIFSSAILNEINNIVSGANKSLEISQEHDDVVYDFSGVSILFAEDVEINSEIFITLFEETNLQIDVAENGHVAVEKFTTDPEKYHMVIMDIQMPVMDGYEATRTIRAMDKPWAKAIPIIAMTANVFKEDIDRCMAAGMNDHLAKPIDVDAVTQKIIQYMKQPV